MPNPNKIRTSKICLPISTLLSRLQEDLEKSYEEIAKHYNTSYLSRFIESVLVRVPIAPIVVCQSIAVNPRLLSVVYGFVQSRFTLEGLTYLPQLNGKGWDDLPGSLRRRINECDVEVMLIEPGTPEEIASDVESLYRMQIGDLIQPAP